MLAEGGGFTISDAASYDAIMKTFMTDEKALKEAGAKAGAYVKDNSGASDAIFGAVFK